MKPVFETTGTCLNIKLPQELDHPASELIRRESDRIMGKIYIRTICFDFGDTEFMDSSGIGLIMGRYKLMQTWGGNVTIANLPPKLEKIVSLSGLRDLCSVVKEVKEVEGEE